MTHLQPSTLHTAQIVVWLASIIMFTLRARPLHVSPLSHSSLSRVRWLILVVYLWTQLDDSSGELEFCQHLQLAFLYLPYHSSSRLILLRPDNTRTNNPNWKLTLFHRRIYIPLSSWQTFQISGWAVAISKMPKQNKCLLYSDTYVSMYVRTYVSTCVCAYVCMYISTYVCAYVLHTYVCMYVCVCVRAHVSDIQQPIVNLFSSTIVFLKRNGEVWDNIFSIRAFFPMFLTQFGLMLVHCRYNCTIKAV